MSITLLNRSGQQEPRLQRFHEHLEMAGYKGQIYDSIIEQLLEVYIRTKKESRPVTAKKPADWDYRE
jgi:hypothetical protein